MNDTWSGVGKVALGTLTYILVIIIDAWGLMLLWGWFIVSTFSVRPLTLVQAAGISLVVSFVTSHNYNTQTDWWRSMAYGILGPIVYITLGWIIHLFL